MRRAEQGVPVALEEVWERIDDKVKQDVGIDPHSEIVIRWQTGEHE